MAEYSRVPVYSLKLVKERSVKYLSRVGDRVDASRVLRIFLSDKDCEHLSVVLLDNHHHLLGLHDVATGGLAGLRAGVRDVFKAAIVHNAAAIVLGHNHPSGDVTPSEEDRLFTEAVYHAGKVMQIPLLDHVIVSSGINEDSFSFLDHGLLPG